MPPAIRRPVTLSRPPSSLPGLNRRLTMELDRGRVRELLIVVGLAGAMLLPLLAYVWQNIEWIESGYAIESLKTRREKLIEANHKLRLERASLESLERVQRLATDQLGLAEPPGGTVVLVSPPLPAQGGTAAHGRLASVRAGNDGRRTEGTKDDDAAHSSTR